ncbi:hypothetical protein RsTz2092_06910 [Deferribacterales bacterium RsTz2092]
MYNVEPYLRKCLDSLLAQTFTNIEVLCVNDGSTDNSLAILQEYASKDERIRVFNHANQGVGYTRNVGLKNARGKYIMWCDPDDWYEPTMCEEMFSAIEREGVDLVECGTNVINEANDSARYEKMSKHVSTKQLGKCILTNDIKKNISGVLWNKIFKRELLERYSILAPVGSVGAEDTAIVWEYLLVSSLYYGLDKVLYNCLVRTDSITGKASDDTIGKYFDNTLLAYRAVVQFAQEYKLLDKVGFVLEFLRNYACQLSADYKYCDFFERLRKDVLNGVDESLLDDRGILFAIKHSQFGQAKQIGDLWMQFSKNRQVLASFVHSKIRSNYGK